MASPSPAHRARLVDISLDTAHMLPPFPRSKDNWCFFPSPSTSPMPAKQHYHEYQYQLYHPNMARKPLGPSAPPTSPRYIGNTVLASRNAEKLSEVCTFVPHALRRRGSDTSDNSPPGLSDDHTGSSDSDASDEERYHATMANLWNSYYLEQPAQQKPAAQHKRPRAQKSAADLRRPSLPQLAPESRTMAPRKSIGDLRRPSMPQHSSEPRVPTIPKELMQKPIVTPPRKSSLDHLTSTQPSLVRSPAQRLTRRATETGPLPTLPAIPTTPPTSSSRQPHDTWPLRSPPAHLSLYPSSNQPGSHPRPSTAPGNQAEKRRSPTPSTSTAPPVPVIEKSFFDYDDDEDKKGSSTLAAKFHIRSLSAGSKKDAEVLHKGPKARNPRRSASEVIKGIFGLSARE